MVGLSKSFGRLARRRGPTESGCNYAMERGEQGKLERTEGKKEGEHYSNGWKRRDGKTCRCEIRWERFLEDDYSCCRAKCWHWPSTSAASGRTRRSGAPGQTCGAGCCPGKRQPGAWKKPIMSHNPTWLSVVLRRHGDGRAESHSRRCHQHPSHPSTPGQGFSAGGSRPRSGSRWSFKWAAASWVVSVLNV